MQIYIRDVSDRMVGKALEAMCNWAQDQRVRKGVVVIHRFHSALEVNKIDYRIVGLYRGADPNRSLEDKGTNYFGIVMGKLAYMIRTSKPSGSGGNLLLGEVAYLGGLVFQANDGWVYIAYSGGNETDDVKIAETGARSLGLME